ncbi:MAG: hypothetical protein R2728_09165 [Chitinophagales bacterium]
MRHSLLSLIFLFSVATVFAQTPKSFSDDDAAFITEFSAYVQKSKRAESIAAETAFVETYNGLSGEMKSTVKTTANLMLTKKVRNYPVFGDYAAIVSLITAKSGEVPQDHIVILKELIDAAEVSSYKQFENYIEYLPALFNERSLFQTKTKNWVYSEGATYKSKVEDGQAVLEFSGIDLMGMSRSDTITIFKTSGKCYPTAEKWVGNKGQLYFTDAGWSESEVTVDLSDYMLDLDKTDFSFDSVMLTFPKHIDGKIMGSMSEKLYTSKPQSITYPQFYSYDLDLAIKNIDERVTTSGGLKLIGDRMAIYGTDEKTAHVILSTNGKKQAVAMAPNFTIRRDKNEIYADNAEVVIYMKKDSLFHPAVIFKYLMDPNIMQLDRAEGIYVNTPYESPYHQMTIELNSLQWNLDSTNIQLKTVDQYTGKPVLFTSYDHYVPQGELRYLTLSGRNPLQMLRDLSNSYGTDYLSGHDLAGQLGYPLKEVESIIYKLAKDGFVFYNPATKDMRVNYKVHHYMDAGKGDIDYDHLQFESASKGSSRNGVLSTDSQTIKLFGIDEFSLSVPKQVKVKPRNHEMVLMADRDMQLEGTLTAGKLTFKGEGIHFVYQDFKADMESVDSLIIFVRGEENELGEAKDVPLKTVISDIKGTLFIDSPGNKSGINDYKEYPYFESYDTAYVYFDDAKDSTTFPRDKFYFQVFPFTLDSIVNTITDSIYFAGRLVSNDIFNPFVTKLTTQPDLTLGIDENTPKEGLDVYKSSGKFYNNLKLLKVGLRGNGKLEYKQATLESKEFEFYEDSLYAQLDTLNIKESVSEDVPQATIGKAKVYWMPYADTMLINGDGDFSLYNTKLGFTGNFLYTGGVLNGISDSATLSKLTFDDAVMEASDVIFNKDHFTTTNGKLEIKAADQTTQIAAGTFGVADVDFSKNVLSVQNEADSFILKIPSNQLLTNIMDYEWDMTSDQIKFVNSEGGEQYFQSTLPVYDSLKFFAQSAVLKSKEGILVASQVNDIGLADSRVIPPGKTLTILPGGTFEPMKNATLVMNKEQEFHTLDKVDLVVRSRNDFSGTGNFKYVGNTGKEYDVYIDEIKVKADTIGRSKKKVDLAYSVEARGAISEEDQFRLDEQLLYKGNMFLSSKQNDIEFDGFARLDLKQNEDPSWFNLSQAIDPDNFSIGLDSLKNESRQEVVTGIYVSPSELEIYSAIMEPSRSVRDNVLHRAEGSLYKGENPGEYIFGLEDAVKGTNPNGSVLKYNDNTGAVEVDGHILWADGIPLVKVDGYGKLNYDPVAKKASGKSVIAIDFPMDDAIWYQLPRDIVEYNFDAKQIEYNRPEIKRALNFFIKEKGTAKTIIEDIEAEGLFKLPVNFSHKILLTDVDLKWDPIDGNFKSTNVIGLSSISGFPIDQQIKAYIEFGYSLGSSYMNLYFETADGEWYFFSTKRGNMFVLSSDQSFNDKVVNAENKEVTDGKKGPVIYEFQPGNMTAKVTFMLRIEDYLSRTGGTIETPKTEDKIEAPVETEDPGLIEGE